MTCKPMEVGGATEVNAERSNEIELIVAYYI